MREILAIDPGPERSSLVYLRNGAIVTTGLDKTNAEIVEMLTFWPVADEILVVEEIESFGMPVGREVFQTVFWAGRFVEAWGGAWALLPRRAIKVHLCRNTRATDATIRQALIDRFGPGRAHAIGTKRAPGPLYGVKADLWAALALGLTYHDTLAPEARVEGVS